MDTNDPFNTFHKSAFRLEALPQYLVNYENVAFEKFKASGVLPRNIWYGVGGFSKTDY